MDFKNGEKVHEERKELSKSSPKKHGTVISFIPNPAYMGVGAKLPLDMCIDWMEEMSYQVDDKIEFEVEEYNGLTLLNKQTIKKKPFSALIDKFLPSEGKVWFGPVSFMGKGSIDEIVKTSKLNKKGVLYETEKPVKKDIKLEFAFAYDQETLEYDYDAFCNFTRTDEGGVHLEGVEDALCRYLQTKTMDSMTDKQREEYPITRNDVKEGLKLVVNLSTNAQVQFMGNAKNKIQNEALRPIIREIAKTELEAYFAANPGKLQEVCKAIRINAKTRIDLQKMRSVAVKGKNSRFDDLEIPNYISANNTGANQYRELLLIEGRKSAAGSMVDGRDANTQAIFAYRGQTLNPFKTTFTKFMENDEWRQYVRVIRCGIGATYSRAKLYFKKIIIATDADVDGMGIGAGIAATHALYLPDIITGGFLYKCYPPLYRIANSEKPFIGNKGELVEIYMKEVLKRYKLRYRDTDYLGKDAFWTFLFDIVDYRFIMNEELYPFYKVPAELIEIAAASLVINGGVDTRGTEPRLVPGIFNDPKFIRDFMQMIQGKFPEITLHGSTVQGVAGGITTSMRINDRFVDKIDQLIPIYQKYGVHVGVKDKKINEDIKMTILNFTDTTASLTPKILTRFKGLGECNPDQLWDTVLNPENRILVQLTMENIERDLEIFRKLKSNKPIYMKQRAEMVESYKIRYDDLDN